MEKLEWRGHPIVKNFEDMFIFSTEYTKVTDGRADRRPNRQTPHDGIGRAYAEHRAAKTFKVQYQHGSRPKMIDLSYLSVDLC